MSNKSSKWPEKGYGSNQRLLALIRPFIVAVSAGAVLLYGEYINGQVAQIPVLKQRIEQAERRIEQTEQNSNRLAQQLKEERDMRKELEARLFDIQSRLDIQDMELEHCGC